MDLVLTLVGIVATVIVVAGVCSKLDLPSPLVLIAVGVVGSYLPFVPDVALEPEVVLFGLLPPLLYAAAIQTSLVDFNANRRAILLLSVGLVAFTAVGVAVVVHALIPDLGWAPAFAIGAVVAPPDAVAATAIGRRIGLPRRIVTILEGESLLNDATALVALNTAIASITATVAWYIVGRDFVVAAGGGILIGLVFFFVIGFVRKHVTDPVIDSSLSFLTPFAAYVTAEQINASGVVSVVVAGLLLAHKSPILQTAQSRIAERMNWRSIAFLLESGVFLLIGLQARSIIGDALGGEMTFGRIAAVCGSTLVGVIVLRVVWVFFARYLLVRPGPDASGKVPPWTYTFLLGWAGMRGVVTLAAAFVIPLHTPHRDVLLLIAFTVTAGTLFIQGLSLPWLAHRLKVPSPDPAADALARANLLHQAGQAGLAKLDELEEDDPHAVSEQIRDRVLRRDNAAWERLGASEDETPSDIYARRRKLMIDAERERVVEIRDTGTVAHEVVDDVLSMLDVEESMLDYSAEERERVRASQKVVSLEGDCEHLRLVRPPVDPDTPGECGDCVRQGTQWVHLRMCVLCGHIACCDSSPERHASAHFAEAGHEVMRSAEAGEDWRWCFVDQLTG
ncbi:Na+/H+ antiporter [Marmoricola sp. URHB0036]|uniref:Na+/H+ antiporter n=1 Tax=Marmoricola sp. URHB0036 TaxID=1298863 RepID=UPI0003FB31B0|nr:Na+/H+ antiporter [Marmoricola sp. URHB0036]